MMRSVLDAVFMFIVKVLTKVVKSEAKKKLETQQISGSGLLCINRPKVVLKIHFIYKSHWNTFLQFNLEN